VPGGVVGGCFVEFGLFALGFGELGFHALEAGLGFCLHVEGFVVFALFVAGYGGVFVLPAFELVREFLDVVVTVHSNSERSFITFQCSFSAFLVLIGIWTWSSEM
jgi:hypothetical protein